MEDKRLEAYVCVLEHRDQGFKFLRRIRVDTEFYKHVEQARELRSFFPHKLSDAVRRLREEPKSEEEFDRWNWDNLATSRPLKDFKD